MLGGEKSGRAKKVCGVVSWVGGGGRIDRTALRNDRGSTGHDSHQGERDKRGEGGVK